MDVSATEPSIIFGVCDFSPLQQNAGLKPRGENSVSSLKFLEADGGQRSPAHWPPFQRSLQRKKPSAGPYPAPFNHLLDREHPTVPLRTDLRGSESPTHLAFQIPTSASGICQGSAVSSGEGLYVRDGEVDNGGILFHKEVVLGEPLDAENKVRRQLGELEALQEVLFVGLVFLKGKRIFFDFPREAKTSLVEV